MSLSADGPPARALEGVRTRRIFALMIDFTFVSFLFVVLFTALGLLGLVTFGLTWFVIPILFPFIALVYNGLTVSGSNMATPGMRLMDLEMRLMNGAPVPFLNAVAHVVFFYLSWTLLTPLVLALALFTSGKRCLHDIGAGVIVTRRI